MSAKITIKDIMHLANRGLEVDAEKLNKKAKRAYLYYNDDLLPDYMDILAEQKDGDYLPPHAVALDRPLSIKQIVSSDLQPISEASQDHLISLAIDKLYEARPRDGAYAFCNMERNGFCLVQSSGDGTYQINVYQNDAVVENKKEMTLKEALMISAKMGYTHSVNAQQVQQLLGEMSGVADGNDFELDSKASRHQEGENYQARLEPGYRMN